MSRSLPASLAFLLLAAFGCRIAAAAIRDSFEAPEPAWVVRDHDCPALRIDEHRRTFDEAHTGHGSEYLRFWVGQGGTQLLLAYPLEPARVIDELIPSLWVKSNRHGLQLLARVVLPRTLDPATGRPITALLAGERYEAAGVWKQLRIENLPLLLSREQRVLLRRFGPGVDTAEAYIDLLVLNAYTGQGNSELWIDDLEVAGFAAPTVETSLISQNQFDQTMTAGRPAIPASDPAVLGSASPGAAYVQGDLLFVEGRPFFARVIRWNGETLASLAQMGFNVIEFNRPPMKNQLEEAQRLNLWVLAPPPAHFDGAAQAAIMDRVLCWPLAGGLTGQDLAAATQRIANLRAAPAELRRPVLCQVVRDVRRFAELTDLILLEQSPIGTSVELTESGTWWRERAARIRPPKPFWAAIQTEYSSTQVAQFRALSEVQRIESDVDAEQIWLQAFQAVASGARGIVFRSEARLDSPDPSSRRRASALEVVNRYLEIIEPWTSAGIASTRSSWQVPGFQASTLETDRSRLLVLCRTAADQQYLVGPANPATPLALPVPGKRTADQVWRIRGSGLEPLRAQPGPAGTVTLEDPGLFSLLVMTNDPLAVNYLGRHTAASRENLTRMELDLTVGQLEGTRHVLQALIQRQQALADAELPLRQVELLLQRSELLLQSRDYAGAYRLLAVAGEQLRAVRKQHWHRAALGFPSPIASPLCVGFRTLPAHWEMAGRMSRAAWGPNAMAAGGFESLDHLLNSGWIQQQGSAAEIHSKIELSLEAARSGRYALQLQAWSREASQLIESWPVWIVSAPVPVRAGQMLRIRGWAKVPRPLTGSAEGLLVFDSMTGPELGTRIHETKGWHEFTLYRAAPNAGDLTVVIAMTGLGEAFVDDLEVSLLP